jgi:uncharacterized protein YyaL (SSP411 family)
MPTNRLASEKSPYLLQHAHNPVDWHPWGEEAFAKARAENKPIFLSIGYSTCHWCHVMERESFENPATAEILNRSFVSIKVDREERPDVDRIYMTYVQATTGSGGWPMSVWLTADLQPFFGGTYFPPESRYGHPGFPQVLERIAEAWSTDHTRIVESAGDVVRQLEQQSRIEPGAAIVDAAALDSGFYVFRRSFDGRQGGFGGAPKFPRPSVFNFLLRYWARTKNREALDMVLMTLQAMALGGMNDQLGGGFHRYSVDERWFVPHFEKMLYDQAQLAVSYLEAYQIAGDPAYADVARATLDYVLRDMTSPEGAFYSAEDADSASDAARPHEKGEGAFYIWTAREIVDIVGQPVAEWLAYRYGVRADGNVGHDPHGEFEGRNILAQVKTVEETAERFSLDPVELDHALAAAEAKLLEARSARIRPHRDDKVLTAWNGLMISAFARAGAILDDPIYAEAARRAADFVQGRLYDPARGVLLRRYRDGEAAIDGFLDDYAYFAQALIDLYETQFDAAHLALARQLTARQRELFEDPVDGGFFASAADPRLVMRVKEDYDGAEPSGNSIAALNLLRLARLTGDADLEAAAARTLRAFAARVSAQPVAAPQMLAAFEFAAAPPRQIVIAGDADAADRHALLRTAAARFLPFHVTMLAAHAPSHAAMPAVGGRAAAYVCENYACQLPVTEPARLAELLQ